MRKQIVTILTLIFLWRGEKMKIGMGAKVITLFLISGLVPLAVIGVSKRLNSKIKEIDIEKE